MFLPYAVDPWKWKAHTQLFEWEKEPHNPDDNGAVVTEQKREAVSNWALRQGTKLEEFQAPNEFWVRWFLPEGALAIRWSFIASVRTVVASEMNRLKHWFL